MSCYPIVAGTHDVMEAVESALRGLDAFVCDGQYLLEITLPRRPDMSDPHAKIGAVRITKI